MKRIILFSRCDLVHLYGKLDSYLSKHHTLIHIAYSDTEEAILREKYNIGEIINFKTEIGKLFENETLDPVLLNTIDLLFIEKTNGRFSLNSSMQSDRTFSYLDYSDSLLLAQVYYRFWDSTISGYKADFLIHEPTALYFTHIASVVCKKYNAEYLTQIQVYGKHDFDWIFVAGDNGYPLELETFLNSGRQIQTEDLNETKQFLESFRNNFEMLVPQLSRTNLDFKKENWLKFFIRTIILILKHIANIQLKKKTPYKTVDHIELYLDNLKPSLSSKIRSYWNKYFHLKFDPLDQNDRYYYYPMHLEPEAVVLYWADGIYKNQVKLIENIAAQLPPGYYLYVKDHPHGGDYRELVDYKRIRAIPNVKLIHPGVSGKELIKKAKGVITLNGTSGFEAVLLNKQVFVFGNSFFDSSDRVEKIKHIRDFRAVLYATLEKIYTDDDNLYRYATAYLKSIHNGFISYYSNRVSDLGIDEERNIDIVAGEIDHFFNRCI